MKAGGIAVAHGNSGGPMILRPRTGPVEAMGVVSAGGGGKFACRIYDGTDCYGEVIYSDITSDLKAFGVGLA